MVLSDPQTTALGCYYEWAFDDSGAADRPKCSVTGRQGGGTRPPPLPPAVLGRHQDRPEGLAQISRST
eukprot:6582439-Pyramimonas_sp.AAC.1